MIIDGEGTVYYNDVDPYCCAVLRQQIAQGNLPRGVVDGRDIRNISAAELVASSQWHLFAGIGGFPLGLKWAGVPSSLRILTGGFPCQDISNAGKRAGITGPRSGLWTEMVRLVRDLRPDYVLVENVAALLGRGMGTVLANLAEAGYDAEWIVLRASDIGAPHRRERIFLVAYPNSNVTWLEDQHAYCKQSGDIPNVCQRALVQCCDGPLSTERTGAGGEALADPGGARLAWRRQSAGVSAQKGWELSTSLERGGGSWADGQQQRAAQSCLGRIFDGLSPWLDGTRWPSGPNEAQKAWEPPRVVLESPPHRVARLHALGNSLLPQLSAEIARCVYLHAQLRGLLPGKVPDGL